jgi:hypothetical protein
MNAGLSEPLVQVADVLGGAEDLQTDHRHFSLRNAQIAWPADGRRFNLTYGPHARENYWSPRHRHTFDQVRLLASGRAKFGPLRMDTYDVCYFPEGVFYGPAELLSEEATTCVIQTQGASWSKVLSQAEQAAAAKAAAQAGQFDTAKGLFRRADGRTQDSYEALLEAALGQPVAYPEPRYQYPTLLRSALFPWRPVSGQPGVAARPLASFGGGPSIGWLRLEAGATAAIEAGERHRLLVVVEGRAACSEPAGVAAGPGTFIHVAPGGRLDLAAAASSFPAMLLALSCEFESRTDL